LGATGIKAAMLRQAGGYKGLIKLNYS